MAETAAYIRVSTLHQSAELQKDALERYGQGLDWISHGSRIRALVRTYQAQSRGDAQTNTAKGV